MGKTLRNTAWRPTSARSFGGTLACRNLSYDVFWMSMRFGTSMTFRTRPRCLRMRKFDWMTLAIAAPDDFAFDPCLGASRRKHGGTGLSFVNGPARALAGRGSLTPRWDLSRKFGRVKQKARRTGEHLA